MKTSDLQDSIRLNHNNIQLKLVVSSGKENDIFVMLSPSIMVSGYGNSEEEARSSFEHNLHLFCKDFLNLNREQREAYLIKLGFEKARLRRKNYSKLYVDQNGMLQELDANTVKTSMFETTECVA